LNHVIAHADSHTYTQTKRTKDEPASLSFKPNVTEKLKQY